MFLKRLAELERPARHDAWLALLEFTEHFGRPHAHGGIGIRKLEGKVFECRAGLRLRLVIVDAPESTRAEFIGSHDEVQKFLRTLR